MRAATATSLLWGALLLVCAPQRPAGAGGAQLEPIFRQAADELGIDFVHRHFGTGEKTMPENMAPGVALFDADGDSRLDVYLVQGAPLPGDPADPEATNRLFLQQRDGTFVDRTREAGVGDPGYGMGTCFGDIDEDGDLDLYVTNFGPDVLYRNRGDGTFEDATAEAGLGSPAWSTSCGFFDPDADGDLDLYVVAYVDYSSTNHKWCGNAQAKIRSYCHPDVYDGLPDLYYRNDGSGRFREVSVEAGILRSDDDKGLGVSFADLDGDGHLDIYVANDSTMNYYYRGDGRGSFEESALLAGLGFNGAGRPEASMGIEIGDLDADGSSDVFVTHLDQETNTLYRNLGQGLFADVTEASGLAAPSLPWVSFGTVLLDFDGDGDLDIFVVNGHIIDNIALFDASRSHRQPAQLFENDGEGRFRDVSPLLGLAEPLVGRGAAGGDLDRDGDVDLVLAQNGGAALVLINEQTRPTSSLTVRLRGTKSNPQGFGARLELLLARSEGGLTRTLRRELKSSTSYLSQGPPEVVFAVRPEEQPVELVIRWPSGAVDRHRRPGAGLHGPFLEGSEVSAPFVPPQSAPQGEQAVQSLHPLPLSARKQGGCVPECSD